MAEKVEIGRATLDSYLLAVLLVSSNISIINRLHLSIYLTNEPGIDSRVPWFFKKKQNKLVHAMYMMY